MSMEWRKLLKGSSSVNICMDLKVELGNGKKNVADIKSKDVYWALIQPVIVPPTAISKWEEIYNNTDFNWEYIFCIPYIVTRETSLRSLQYMILNRYFPCNYTLSKWYPNHTYVCNFCNCTDDLEHYFFNCKVVSLFWKMFFNWWSSTTHTAIHLTCMDIIFGIHNPNNDIVIDAYNYCILLAKQFIYSMKIDMKECDFYLYQIMLKNRLEIENVICMQNQVCQSFQEKWGDIVDSL